MKNYSVLISLNPSFKQKKHTFVILEVFLRKKIHYHEKKVSELRLEIAINKLGNVISFIYVYSKSKTKYE